MDDQWQSPPGSDGPLGESPSAEDGAVARSLWEHMSSQVAGYLLSGVLVTLSMMVIFSGLFAAAAVMVVPGMAMEDENLTSIGFALGGALFVGGMLVIMAVYPLLQASLIRAVDASRRDDTQAVSWNSAFDTMTTDAPRIILFFVVTTAVTLLAGIFCYLPAIPVWALVTFAMPIVVLEGAGVGEALSVAARHMGQNPVWHLAVWVIAFLILMVLGFTGLGSVVSLPILAGYQVFAYRAAFGEEGALGGVA